MWLVKDGKTNNQKYDLNISGRIKAEDFDEETAQIFVQEVRNYDLNFVTLQKTHLRGCGLIKLDDYAPFSLMETGMEQVSVSRKDCKN